MAGADTEAAGGGGERKAPADGADPDGATLDRDELFHLLQSERRRRAIRYLLAADEEPIVMRDVAEAVAADEYDTTVALLGSEKRQRVYITLYQSHLPQLAEAGVITYDRERGEITTTPLVDEFEVYLGDRSPADVDRKKRVWGATGYGLGTLVALAAVPLLGTGMTLGVAVLVVAAVMTVDSRIANGDETGWS